MIGTSTPVHPNPCICIPTSKRLDDRRRQTFERSPGPEHLARLSPRQGFAYAGKLAQQLELGSTEKGRSRAAGALDSQLDAILRLFALLDLGESPLFPAGQKVALQALEAPCGFQRQLAFGSVEGMKVPISRERLPRVLQSLDQPPYEGVHPVPTPADPVPTRRCGAALGFRDFGPPRSRSSSGPKNSAGRRVEREPRTELPSGEYSARNCREYGTARCRQTRRPDPPASPGRTRGGSGSAAWPDPAPRRGCERF